VDIDGLIIKWLMVGMGAGFVLGWVTAWLTVLRHTSSPTQSRSSTEGDQA
jgi:hypothetical protein